jgi:hypothetical protein
MEVVYLFSMPGKESAITDLFLGISLRIRFEDCASAEADTLACTPDARHLLPLGTTMVTPVWVFSAPRR